MIETLTLPFQFEFMRHAYLIGGILALPTAVLSCFLVLRGWALMGDAISHAVLPGLVLAWWVGVPLLIGAFIAGMFCALVSGYIAEYSRIKPDTIMGVVFSGFFGIGIVLFVASGTDLDLHHILLGNMLGVSASDMVLSGAVGLVVTAAVLMGRKELLLYCFDPIQAHALGLPRRCLHYGLLAALALCVITALSAMGIILAIGLLITPGAIAFLLTRRFTTMLILSVVISEAAMVIGITLSFWGDSAPAPTVMLVLAAAFMAAFIKRGVQMRAAAGHQAGV